MAERQTTIAGTEDAVSDSEQARKKRERQASRWENTTGKQPEFFSRGGRYDDLPGQETMFEVD